VYTALEPHRIRTNRLTGSSWGSERTPSVNLDLRADKTLPTESYRKVLVWAEVLNVESPLMDAIKLKTLNRVRLQIMCLKWAGC
jgi:hypothetical protein